MNLWLDDLRPPPPNFIWVKTAEEAIKVLSDSRVEHCSLDHDLGTDATGYSVVNWMEANNIWPTKSCQVHSQNPVGAYKMGHVIAKHYNCSINQIIHPYNFE